MSTPTTDLGSPAGSDADLEVGARVGEYEVEGKLGQGAFGTVFRAMHPLIGKLVAIKVLARKFSVDEEMVSRFVAEARAVNQIRHRNIIDIFSFGQLSDGRQYYVMEYLDGEPLDALIDREHRVPIGEAIEILKGIAKALDAAHAKGVAHRDLKAENILLARDPDGGVFPKLLDFGIAKLMAPEDGLKHKTRTGAPIGTPYYMSPEQCRGRDVNHRTDHYAFGVLTYRMLTGAYPHDGDDYMSILMKQIAETPSAPSTHNGELTSDIDDVIAWMMAKDPAQRPPDLRTAVRGLEQAAAAAGLVEVATSAWDVQTGPKSLNTVAVPKVQTAPVAAVSARTMGAPGVSADSALPLPLPRRSRTALYAGIGVLAALVAVVVLYVVSNKHTDAPPREPELPQHAQTPPPMPPPPQKEVPVTDPGPGSGSSVAQTVIVTVAGVPEGTEVIAGGMTVGAAPGPVQLPRDKTPMLLTFKADGYLMASIEVVPDKDQPLTVTLKKRAAAGGGGGGRPRGKDDIEDPFARKGR